MAQFVTEAYKYFGFTTDLSVGSWIMYLFIGLSEDKSPAKPFQKGRSFI